METKQQVEVFLINKKCPKCNEGDMIFDGNSFTAGITVYSHICNQCGYKDAYANQKYPKIEYEPISPVLDVVIDPEKVITVDPLMIQEDGKIRTETDEDRQKQEIEKNKIFMQQK
jgi:hypothetical protein